MQESRLVYSLARSRWSLEHTEDTERIFIAKHGYNTPSLATI